MTPGIGRAGVPQARAPQRLRARGLALALLAAAALGAPAMHSLAPMVRAEELPPIPAAELVARTREVRSQYGIPGMQVAIVYPDGRAWSTVTGFADVTAKVRPVRGTPYAVGSITKTFVAALVLGLVAEGTVDLDAPAAAYLPSAGLDPAITVRMLLGHTSGLYDYFSNARIDPALRSAKKRVWAPARALEYVKPPYFLPGAGWAYSNTNFLYLGLIAEAVDGRPLAEQLRERFLRPLRLASTFLQAAEPARKIPTAHAYTFDSLSKWARPIDQVDGTGVVPFTSVTTAAGAAGAIASSAWDLARWARALYTGKVVPSELLVQMEDTAASTAFGTVAYGLGMRSDTIGGYRAIGHTGRLVGVWASMRYFPDLGLTIAVTTNQWRWNPERVTAALLPIAVQGLALPNQPLAGAGVVR